jgi:DNA-binding LacI/PurR family transcriptional regulator
MKKRITSTDVAKEAGVSRATVSYILNNTPGVRISDDTKEKVMEVARRLGYHLDFNARALKTNRSMSIAVVSRRDVTETRFTKVLGGIKEVLSKEKYSILICSDENDENGYPEYYSLYHGKKIDGIIFISYQEQLEDDRAAKLSEIMLKEGIPCVFADYHLDNPMLNCIDINYFHGAYMTTKYLIEKGYKSIAFLLPDTNTVQERHRLAGVKKAIEETKDTELLIYNAGRSSEENDKSIMEALKEKDKYSALIAAWGRVGAKILYYTNKMDISVPEEIAVIALASEEASEYTYPKLSLCELPLYEMGVRSAQSLLENISNTEMPVSIKLPCSLRIKEST